MKKYLYILPALAMAMGATSCDDDDDVYVVPQPEAPAKVVNTSIADGAAVDASTTSIHIEYSMPVAINSAVTPTINGEPVKSFDYLADADGKAMSNSLQATFALEAGQQYVLVIPERAVTGVGTSSWCPELRLSFSAQDLPPVVTDIQAITNSSATPEAKKLYSSLLGLYGNKTLSGAMGGVAWELTYSDFIAQEAGAYPAVVGFDYIHLASSPSNWIDYGDITPVKTVWEAGSIPAISWHWNVPKPDGSGFDASVDDFKASNVLIEGTDENRIAVADVEKLAGYLKLLQDADIPVLWRPFHEAAGDYTWGSWFWWGNSGTETTKELWKWLRNKLEGEYGLNNLIWVWTMQCSDAGQLAQVQLLRDAYPGDEVVDIVGADLYEAAGADVSAQFQLVNRAVDGKKMVALAECGNIPAISASDLWIYFMGWYEMSDGQPVKNQWNLNGEWAAAAANPLVASRGQFSVK